MPTKREFTQKKTVCVEHKNYTSQESLIRTLFDVGVRFIYLFFLLKSPSSGSNRGEEKKIVDPNILEKICTRRQRKQFKVFSLIACIHSLRKAQQRK